MNGSSSTEPSLLGVMWKNNLLPGNSQANFLTDSHQTLKTCCMQVNRMQIPLQPKLKDSYGWKNPGTLQGWRGRAPTCTNAAERAAGCGGKKEQAVEPFLRTTDTETGRLFFKS